MTAGPESGLVVVDKPAGLTSHDVVARVRRLGGTRKVGHAGTLDPMATGVLLVGVNRATRLLGHLTLTEKAYAATLRLGTSSSTDDAEGVLSAPTSTQDVREDDVRAAAATFLGEIQQVPSQVSAVKIDGRRAYARVRAGETVEIPAREVVVHQLVVGDLRREGGALDVDLRVRCSSGTYIRALARDLGVALGTGGHLTALRRTAVGPFGLDEAATLEELAQDWSLCGMSEVARRCFPARDLDEAETADVAVGRKLDVDLGTAGPVALFDPFGDFLALYEQRDAVAAPVAVFTG